MVLPTFIVIGAMKSGTTSLHNYMKFHPQITMTKRKEVNFFCYDNNWSQGTEWYENQFRSDNKDAIAFGDISPRYSKCHSHPLTPSRMHELVPEAKIIYLARNPIKRFMSHYVHNYAKMQTSLTFDDYIDREIEKRGNALKTSLYHFQISHYLKEFPQEQIKVIKSESLLKNRRETLFDIFDFIGVDRHYNEEKYDKEYHQGSQKVRPRTYVAWTHRYPKLFKKVWKMHSSSMRGLFFREFDRPVAKPEQIQRLSEILREDSEQLASLTGIDISDWYESA